MRSRIGPLAVIAPEPIAGGGVPGTARSSIIAEAEGVQVSYQTRAGELVALGGVDLSVRVDEFVCLVGPSGCGKSTLLKAVAGLVRANVGSVSVAGVPVTGPPPQAVYLFQQYNRSLFPWKTVAQNVEFGINHGPRLRGEARRHRVEELLELVGLASYSGLYPSQLSGGMQQRVTIARALAREPELLLMDEPFSSLDAFTRHEVQDLLLDIWQRSALTVIFVTHDIDEAIYLGDRVLAMDARPGRIVAEFTVPLVRPRSQVATRADPKFSRLRARIATLLEGRRDGR